MTKDQEKTQEEINQEIEEELLNLKNEEKEIEKETNGGSIFKNILFYLGVSIVIVVILIRLYSWVEFF